MGQPKVDPLPSGIDLNGKTAVVTGASAGLGLETARQLLRLGCSTMVLAVRNVAKGESCAQELQQDPAIKARKPTIKVLKFDADRYDSVQDFAKALQRDVPVVHILVLNAGIGCLKMERSSTGHEQALQINYLSNVLLLAELLPYLEASADKSGSPTRITWVGSRKHDGGISFESKAPLGAEESVLERMNSEEKYVPWCRYADSKLLCAMFMYSLAPRLDKEKIILNMVCPGMISTGISAFLPLHIRLLFNVLFFVRARSAEVGGWLIINAAVVAGPESHGRHLGDKQILDVSEYIQSSAGQSFQKKLWVETMEEMKKFTVLPLEFR
ncbi:short-chain dehydrogenase/reductase family protein [Penicillium hispanicum]|uniref:short-chain dehydrogenase/reductase family protein n=1 Tax=Penicillium hispanicum TaxID=1080232 RepID=UPI0025403FA6|nr:short-chain dehydrogenase/reductase family protein [Penicillium hispanicum]KAJ5579491.1 short-chain dehydrogenase/reductase family protein [Penicillium hispanicum]